MTADETYKTGELILNVMKDKTLIVVEHDIDFVKQISEKITVLSQDAGVDFELYESKGALQILNTYYPDKISYRKYETREDGTFGVFIFVGYVPLTKLFEGKVKMEDGYIITDEEMKTNIQGVFACGDLRPKMLKQVITATAQWDFWV